MEDGKKVVTFCAIPDRVFEVLSGQNIVVRFDSVENQAVFVNSETGNILISLFFGDAEERCELAMIHNDSVEYTLPIHWAMRVDPKTLSGFAPRVKSSGRKKDKSGSMLTIDQVEVPMPLVLPDDLCEWNLLKVKILETVKLARELEDEQGKLGVLQGLAKFVLRETKIRDDLNAVRLQVQNSMSKRQCELLFQSLYCLSLKL
jgi:hypothetical protein